MKKKQVRNKCFCGAEVKSGLCCEFQWATVELARGPLTCHCGDVGGGDCCHTYARDEAYDIMARHDAARIVVEAAL